MMIKNWPYFRGVTPYASWCSCSVEELKMVPLKNPCKLHADPEFDVYVAGCGCEEWKFVKRSREEIDQIKALQKRVSEEACLERANEILRSREVVKVD